MNGTRKETPRKHFQHFLFQKENKRSTRNRAIIIREANARMAKPEIQIKIILRVFFFQVLMELSSRETPDIARKSAK
jgi:hypothetical protein